ncbi:MAG TPA: hypothetical protein VGH19_05320, partial [Verrucomicrobiae bacterium]
CRSSRNWTCVKIKPNQFLKPDALANSKCVHHVPAHLSTISPVFTGARVESVLSFWKFDVHRQFVWEEFFLNT